MNQVVPQTETLNYSAAVEQLLQLVTKSLYSNKEIFLRELISNAADANEKLRTSALTDKALYENDPELKIWIDIDKENHFIKIRDNGIGMDREEIAKNLGTIAHSGTKIYQEMLQNQDSQLIGQFGVGFYSSFIVADKVVVRSRRAGMQTNLGVQWESDGKSVFTIKNIEKIDRGTEIVLHLKKDEAEFLDQMRLRTIIKKYSDSIYFPIIMKKMDTPDAVTSEKKEKDEIVVPEDEVVNRAKALWTRAKQEITDEEYREFYKYIAHDFEDPLTWMHRRIEGNIDFTTLLYVPARAPFDLFHREGQRGLKLYVKRVFIMDDAEHFLPLYLRFMKGIVDCNDLPLNISRELLQNNRMIEQIKSRCTKFILELLENLAKDKPEEYQKFWVEFGQVMKEGPSEDSENRDRIAKLLRFSSTHTDQEKQNMSLADYISRMKEDQQKIYYLIADNFMAAKNSPLLELFRKKGIEVLLMCDKIDEWLVSHLREYEGKSLQSISQGSIDLSEIEKTSNEIKEEEKQQEEEYSDSLGRIKEALGDRVKEVRITYRLTESPACIVYDDDELTGHMQRILRAAGQNFMPSKPILELNPAHPIVIKVKEEQDKTKVGRWADILLNQALLAEGEPLQDPASFVKGLNELILQLAE